jgi:hypothetical protein
MLLIPIIGIEAYVFKKRLGVSGSRALGVSALANIASTIIGTFIVVGSSLLLYAGAGISELPGALGDITVLMVLIPCFFLSFWCESLVGSPMIRTVSRQDVRAAFFLANKFSYALLAILPIARLVKNAIVQGRIVW